MSHGTGEGEEQEVSDGRMESTVKSSCPARPTPRHGSLCRTREKEVRQCRRSAPGVVVRAVESSRFLRSTLEIQAREAGRKEKAMIESRQSMQEILVTLGNRIRRLRERNGISQEAFADNCGLHRTAVGLIERGKSIPRLDSLLAISEHLGIAVSELLEGLKH